jgi:hypothetical protein
MTPYRTLPATVHARQTQVVFYDVDFLTMALPAGHNHVCAAAFVTTISASDRLLDPGNPSVDALTMIDRHVAHRNLHLVPAEAMPVAPGATTFRHQPGTIVVDFYNADRDEAAIELVVDRRGFPGQLSMLLPPLDHGSQKTLVGWHVKRYPVGETEDDRLGAVLQRLGEAMEKMGDELELAGAPLHGEAVVRHDRKSHLKKLAQLDRTQVIVADDDTKVLRLGALRLPAGGHISAAITLSVPPSAKPGDEFEFDVIQERRGVVVGGSTYVIAVFDASKKRED